MIDILSQDEKRIGDLIVNDPTYCSSDQGYDPQPYMAAVMEFLRRGEFTDVERGRLVDRLTAQCLRDVNWTLKNEAEVEVDAADALIAEEESRGRLERSLGMSLPHAA